MIPIRRHRPTPLGPSTIPERTDLASLHRTAAEVCGLARLARAHAVAACRSAGCARANAMVVLDRARKLA